MGLFWLALTNYQEEEEEEEEEEEDREVQWQLYCYKTFVNR